MVLQLNSNAVLAIDKLLLVKGGQSTSFLTDSREARIQLIRGSLYSITAETFVPTDLLITTPAGEVTTSQKSSVYVRAAPEGVRLLNYQGQVNFRARARSSADTLPAGKFADWASNTGALISEFRAVDGDSDAFERSKEAVAVESKVMNLLRKPINVGFDRQTP